MARNNEGSQNQYGDVTGDVGTVIEGATGPVVLNGNVHIHNTDNISELGAVVVNGDNYGGLGYSK
ncbi:hypothetical protein [Streptomyces sp. Rer75]|uniref:hypothetical protein n=1 Tax=Streptomyces sp. Rer75 TaxID=2750011 RepID=UPI0015CFB3C1|nr:hypothetical protein [Streptomyces sp. Rer75]QLH19284.1 hypothetical protein HYQ63_00045 [Streptomyces sp. Rer75]